MSILPHQSEIIQATMHDVFPPAEPHVALFYAMQEYHLGWRDESLAATKADTGKLIRPRLCTLACQAVGGDPQQALPLAAALQLFHDFTLIHDDIEDHSPTRRGRSTVWKLWGQPQAINAGDGMFTLAQMAVLKLIDHGVAPALVVELAQRFNAMAIRVCEGQHLDMSFEERLDITEADYLAMIGRKTAALITATTQFGAILGHGSAEHIAALTEFGESLGLAFQIEDDILGIWGKEAETGKPDAHDIWGRKKSIPIIRALSSGEQQAVDTLREIYARPDINATDVETVLSILAQTDARSYTAAMAQAHHQRAIAALDRLHDGEATAVAELRQIAQKLLGRAR